MFGANDLRRWRMLVGLVVLSWLALPRLAHGDRAEAKKLVASGNELYRAKPNFYKEASKQFMKAIEADPTAMDARYMLAVTSSLSGDLQMALEQLSLIKRAAEDDNDAAAKKFLQKAQKERALDFVSVLPGARDVLHLPDEIEVGNLEWLEERAGVWSMEGDGCARPARTLTFKRGKVSAVVLDCNGKKTSFSGVAKEDHNGVPFIDWKGKSPFPGFMHMATDERECVGRELRTCILLWVGDEAVGLFHRGQPTLRSAMMFTK